MPTALQIVQRYYPGVTSIVDSKRRTTIEVTKQDCASRAVKNHKECAMAVACKRQGADGAIIAVKVSYLIKGNKAIRYRNPESVSREVVAFDRNAGFEPGEYHLAPIPPSGEVGVVRKPGKKTNQAKTHYHRTENVRILEH